MSCLSFGQSKKLKQANRLFNNRSYIEAAALYEELEPTQEVLTNLGDSYFYNSQIENARDAYNQLFNKYKDSLNKEIYFRYAHALKGVKDYTNALDRFNNRKLGRVSLREGL